MGKLVPKIVPGDPNTIAYAIAKLDSKLNTGASPTFVGITLSDLTASRLMATDASKVFESVADLTSWITGTANQVVVADDNDGTITLSLPQDIHAAATPTFADLTLSSPSNIYGLSHDSFADFVATEHLDHALNQDANLILWVRGYLSDTDAIDEAGSNTWSQNGGATNTDAGVIGPALTFDGTGDWFTDATPDNLPTGTSARTIFARIRKNAADSMAVFSYGGAANGASFSIRAKSTGQFVVTVAGGNVFSTSTVLNDLKWHTIAVTFDPDDTGFSGSGDIRNAKLYVDGIFTANIASVEEIINTTNEDAFIGVYRDATVLPYNGEIDELRVYNRVLDATELLELHQLGTLDAMTTFDAAYFKEYVASRSGYFNRLHVSGSTVVTDITADSLTTDALTVANYGSTSFNGVILTDTGDIFPEDDTQYDLGSSSLAWQNLFIENIIVENGGSINVVGGPILRFDSTNSFFEFTNGDVGIRTTTPVTALDVNGTITASALIVDTDTLVVDAVNHKVGIRTASPTGPLELVSEVNSEYPFYCTSYGSGIIPTPGFVGRGARGTLASPSPTLSQDPLFLAAGRGYITGAWETTSPVIMQMHAAEDHTSTNQGTFIIFKTTEIGSTGSVERMRIKDDGTIKIPGLVEVKTPAGFNRAMELGPQNTVNGNGAYIEFTVSSVDGYGPQIGGIRESGGAGYLTFRTGTNSQVERMRIEDNGNIVLGGTSAKTRLTVEGAITLKEQAAADGDNAGYGQLWVKNTSPCQLWFTDDLGNDARLDNLSGTTMTTLTLTDPTQDWKFSATQTTGALGLQSQTSGVQPRLQLFSKDGDETDNVFIDIFGQGTPASISTSHNLALGYSQNDNDYIISSTSKSLRLHSGGGAIQITLNTDGSINIGGDIIIADGSKIGIGTVPSDFLHVKNDAADTTFIKVENANADGAAGINLVNDAAAVIQFGVYGSTHADYGAVKAGEGWIYSDGSLTIITDTASGIIKFATGGNAETVRIEAAGNLRLQSTLRIKERAAADGDIAAYGQLWVKNTDPTELWFTSDTGVDTQIV